MRVFIFFGVYLLCLCVCTGFAEEGSGKKPSGQKPPPAQKVVTPPAADEMVKARHADIKKREPFRITPEFEAQMEEVEPPEIEVTGILKARGKTVAMVKLELDKVEGRTVLRPGMRVSIPKPDREESESERWMTYFTVKKITSNGMVIVLENGETVWYPVMGELD